MGDDEEEISSDDSNNDDVEFFSVHHIERDDSHRQSTVSDESFDEGLESEYDLESVISDEGVPLESCDSSTYNSSDSDSDYATEKNEVNEQDFHHADIEEILVDDKDVDGASELRNFLANFVTNKNLSGSAGNYLLKGLKALKHQNHQFDGLPRDIRTLRKTPRKVVVEHICGGTYFHFGLEKGIASRLSELLNRKVLFSSLLEILINADGLPLFKSTRQEFWVLLALIKGDNQPTPVGVFSGAGKPNYCNDFLRKFVIEANYLAEHGLLHQGQVYDVKIIGFPCDAPARSFISGSRGHTAKNACHKCRTNGVYYRKPGKKGGRITYPDMDAALRLHDDFLSDKSRDYYLFRSILADIDGIDMVKDFPSDYMHLCCLGVMKKLLHHWLNRETVYHLISPDTVDEITRRLLLIRRFIPNDFVRKARSLTELCRWKATELRLFLLYIGPVILRDILPRALYDHFMVFHLAMKILSSAKTCYKYNTFAVQLMRHFVSESVKLYGGHFITFNVHCLIHLPLDVLRFGPLDHFSCFPFENALYRLKRLIRNSSNPLAQLVKRLSELSNYPSIPSSLHFSLVPIVSRPHDNGPLLEGLDDFEQFQTLIYKRWRITIRPPNNNVQLELDDKSTAVVTIENIIRGGDGSIFIVGSIFEQENSFFMAPCDSNSILSIKYVDCLSPTLQLWPVAFILYKMFLVPNVFNCEEPEEEGGERYVAFPLLMENKIE